MEWIGWDEMIGTSYFLLLSLFIFFYLNCLLYNFLGGNGIIWSHKERGGCQCETGGFEGKVKRRCRGWG